MSNATRTNGPAPVIEARRVAGAERDRSSDDFTYTVLLDAGQSSGSDERRLSRRQRTRLRSGKIVDREGRFVTECLVHDLSAAGGRLRLPAGVPLPPAIQFYDDQTGALHRAAVLWRRDRDAGIQFVPEVATPRSAKIAAEMRRKFYAVRD